jgi:ABC-2 type transport system permease protein
MRRSLEETWVLAARSLRRTLRNPTVVVAYLFQPLLLLLIFTKVFSSVGQSSAFRVQGYSSYLSFFLPAVLVLGVLGPALTSGTATVIDLHTGALDGFLRTPVRRSSVLAGKLAADATRMLVTCAVLVVAAVPVGARLAGPVAVMGAMVLTCGFGMGLAGLSNLLALRTRSAEATNALSNLAALPLMFVSTAYMPRAMLPRWLQLASSANPLTYVIDGTRRLMTAGPAIAADQVAIAAGVVVVLGVLTLAGSARAFQRVIG